MEFKKKIALTLLTIGLTATTHAQIGLGTVVPNKSAQLDINSTKKGFLLPRVALVKTTEQTPVTSPAISLLVYNTASNNDVTPGYYYWEGTKWARIARTDEIVLSPEQIAALTGATGPQGIQGLPGEKGDKGEKGIDGIQGIQGEKGDKGDKGDQGNNGIQGIQGIAGIGGKTNAGTNIAISGAGTEESPYIVNAVLPNAVNTANNGLTVTNNTNIQLGGDLTKSTTVTTTATNTLAIKGLQTGGATDNIMVTDANGILKTIARTSLGGGDNLGDHTATTDLAMSNNNINNVKNLDVKGTSTLAGKVYAKTTNIAPANGSSQVMVDNSTGELYRVGSSSSANAKPFSYANYTLSNVDKDFVSSFNTKINSNLYTIIIVGSSFNKSINLFDNGVPALNVIAQIVGTEWVIKADYLNASTTDNLNGTWDINVMIINNSMVNIISPQSFNLNGSNVGSATAPPAGI